MAAIDYAFARTAGDCLDIDDAGNCAIEANNIEGLFWYMIVDTRLGWTKIMTYGPIDPESPILENNCSCTFERFEFNHPKIIKAIDTFLNKMKIKKISPIFQAHMVDRDYALSRCRSIIEAMKNVEEF